MYVILQHYILNIKLSDLIFDVIAIIDGVDGP